METRLNLCILPTPNIFTKVVITIAAPYEERRLKHGGGITDLRKSAAEIRYASELRVKVRVFETQRWIVSTRGGVETSGNIWPGRMRASSRLISLQRHAIGNIIQHPNSAFTLPLSSPPAAYTLNGFIIQYIQGHSYITILVCWLAKSNG